jgi:hypothetical protein
MRLSARIAPVVAGVALVLCGTATAGIGSRPIQDLGSFDASSPATAQQGDCLLPGLDGTVVGSGTVVVNQNGTNFNCHGTLPESVPPPDQPVTVDLGDCTTKVTPSGKAKTSCHSKP